ncbi:MAG TPA: JAB domain-containing protein [Candidatus Saccharimonadales bacterium]|nr:JAB domain-containing protein [Candidatus Saccharimonadales bacterium]
MKETRLTATPQVVLARLDFIRNRKQEYFLCLSLDSGGRIIARRTVTIGLLDVAIAHPREVFAGPLKDRAASVIIAHNHPSGIAEPSKQDIETTQRLVAAAQLLGITLQDHVIVTRKFHFSFRDKGLL